MAKEVAVRKRAMIDRASRNMFLVVAAASVVLGVTIVGAIHISKWIAFNAKVIGEKAKIIDDYNTSLKNLPALEGAIERLSSNEDLEAVARKREVICESFEGEKYTSVMALRECSALRVIPDALPATQNPEALLASLNKVFLLSGTTPEALSPSDTGAVNATTGVDAIPISLSISGDGTLTKTVLDNIEKSIRTFEMGTVTIEWRGQDTILLRGQSSAFYSQEKTAELLKRTVNADDSKKKGTTSK